MHCRRQENEFLKLKMQIKEVLMMSVLTSLHIGLCHNNVTVSYHNLTYLSFIVDPLCAIICSPRRANNFQSIVKFCQ